MFLAFIYFILGVFTLRIAQFLISANNSYKMYKEAEMTSLNIFLQLHIDKELSVKILTTLSKEMDSEDVSKLEKVIKQKYDTLINNGINKLKMKLPYKVKYTNIYEAANLYLKGDTDDERR